MKTIQSILFLSAAIAITGIYTSCKKESLPNNGEPQIRYVRITAPESADSLLVGAYQSNLIAIIGENLQDAQEIWFNDQKASLTPTYITSTTILVSVPAEIPKEISNTLKILFSNGKTLEHHFKVEISEPLVSAMNSEYVLTGNVATIRGDYFYEPLTVTFTGNVQGELVSVEDKVIRVIVPEGAEPGPVTVTTNFGVTSSDFWFRDNRNIFISSDPFTGWWNASFVVETPGPDDPPAINGNYIRVKRDIGGWNWLEVAGGPPDAMGDISKNIPDEAILKPEDYNLKFEVNTLKPYNNNMIKINAGLSKDFNNDQYLWAPPYDTKGEWQTVVIPFNEIATSYGESLSVSANGYYTRILFHGGGDLDCDMCFDNFRIVPKVLKK
ncbi:glycan-binding surface protein [Agriterribacter sp.]|uniref:glycan-binding surface protein n=1 Tax=Agriterribacter sp. TaxID=2821509 RepID=UPI002CED035C|nr:glycan-binding surface protein [Agriterribacter sp.]HRP56329.1 glycan-binding surface protein [Agriterribacter sp.]